MPSSPADVHIRPGVPEDAEALARIYQAAGQAAWGHIVDTSLIVADTARWEELLREPDRAVFVAEIDGAPVGFSGVRPSPDADTDEDVGEIHHVFTLPAHWGAGAGRLLLEIALTELARRGCTTATLWTAETNTRPRAIYERFGFVPDGCTRGDPSHGGTRTYESLRYRRSLGDARACSLSDARDLLAGFDAPWWVAGGHAIDLFLGRETRRHSDVDLLIAREDQERLHTHLPDWEIRCVEDHRLRSWPAEEWLSPPIHEFWARPVGAPAWTLEFLLAEIADGTWTFRRDDRVRRSVDELGLVADGIPFVAPEIVLLYKAKGPRERDEADFRIAVPELGRTRGAWLREALALVYPGHPWLEAGL